MRERPPREPEPVRMYDDPDLVKCYPVPGLKHPNGEPFTVWASAATGSAYPYWDEGTARYGSCTHKRCATPGCESIVPKGGMSKCRGCLDLAAELRYEGLPVVPWDGEAWLYSDAHDRYFDGMEAADEFAHEEDGRTLADLHLMICKPNHVRPLESDYCADELPEDGDLPNEIAAAMEAFNEAVRGYVLSWSPGKTRPDLTPYLIEAAS